MKTEANQALQRTSMADADCANAHSAPATLFSDL